LRLLKVLTGLHWNALLHYGNGQLRMRCIAVKESRAVQSTCTVIGSGTNVPAGDSGNAGNAPPTASTPTAGNTTAPAPSTPPPAVPMNAPATGVIDGNDCAAPARVPAGSSDRRLDTGVLRVATYNTEFLFDGVSDTDASRWKGNPSGTPRLSDYMDCAA
jgi:hypothetical protein